MNELRKKIMRRVYYVYALRLAKHPYFVHTTVMVLGFIALSSVVSIPNVWANMLEVRVGDLARFWGNAFLNTGVLNLTLIGVIVLAGLSLPLRLRRYEEVDEAWAFR